MVEGNREPDERGQPRAGIRVLLCDDHELVRRGVATLLEDASDMWVVGEAGTADEAVILAVQLNPDVVVMDVRLPGRSGIEACRDIRALREGIRVLMLTSFADDEALLSSILAGASGFFLKKIQGRELIEAIRQVAAGASLLDPLATERVLAKLRGDAVAGEHDG